jgi:hypothetical protein
MTASAQQVKQETLTAKGVIVQAEFFTETPTTPVMLAIQDREALAHITLETATMALMIGFRGDGSYEITEVRAGDVQFYRARRAATGEEIGLSPSGEQTPERKAEYERMVTGMVGWPFTDLAGDA